MRKWILLILLATFPQLLPAISQTGLYVQIPEAKIYNRPAADARVITRLSWGDSVRELRRRGRWIEVQELEGQGEIGWVFAPALGRQDSGGDDDSQEKESFQRFMRELEQLNQIVSRAAGLIFFTGAEDLGEGTVRVIATRRWLATPQLHRESNLQTILRLWKKVNSDDRSLAVEVVDLKGEPRMSMAFH